MTANDSGDSGDSGDRQRLRPLAGNPIGAVVGSDQIASTEHFAQQHPDAAPVRPPHGLGDLHRRSRSPEITESPKYRAPFLAAPEILGRAQHLPAAGVLVERRDLLQVLAGAGDVALGMDAQLASAHQPIGGVGAKPSQFINGFFAVAVPLDDVAKLCPARSRSGDTVLGGHR